MILLNDVLSCMVCSNFEPLGRTNQKNLRLCHQKWIPHSLESRFWSKRSNLSLEQKNSISVFVLGVFSDFLTFVFSWLCGVFLILWCVFLLLRYFSIFVIFFLLCWYFLTFVIFNDTCFFFFLTFVVFFDFWGIFWLLWCFFWLGVRYFLGVIA